ncbi:MAG TPA: hypothetical protein VFQ05_08025, partial [Candidatus Eisenbacteria bacterium]|nr:hypothetical protein [Candidatus Eisenbacteria bacterium]
HQIPSGDLSAVFERVLEIAVKQLEKQKFAATDRPRRMQPAANGNPRYIPRHVKRAVWRRDGGRCTFISSDGHRCGERSRLEFDHVVPVARGGQSTVSGIRLRCRAHNLYAAECAFGADWMRGKREEARAAAATRKQAVADENAKAPDSAKALAVQAVEEVIPYLRALRIPARDARLAAEKCTSIPSAPLEERVRLALSSFGPRKTFTRPVNTAFAP